MKKILSLILLASLLLSLFSSCSRTPESLIEKAEKKLKKGSYEIEVSVDYTVADEEIALIFEQLESSETKILVEKDGVAIEKALVIDYGEVKSEFINTYVIVGGRVFLDMSYKSNGAVNSTKSSAALTDAEREDIVNRAKLIGNIGINSFNEVKCERLDGEYRIICTEVKEDSRARLEGILISELEGAVETVGIRSSCLTIVIDRSRYDSVTLECEYEITLSGKTYSLRAEYELEYDFDEWVDITIPENYASYSEVDLNAILDTL